MEEQTKKLVEFARKYGYTDGDFLKQAECMEHYGVVIHQNLCIYPTEILRKTTVLMQTSQI